MELLFALALLAIAIAIGFRALHGQTLFSLEIQGDGSVKTLKGTPPTGYVSACEDVVRLNGLSGGKIKAVQKGSKVAMRFSKDIPEHARQAFRNIWHPPSPPGSGGARARG